MHEVPQANEIIMMHRIINMGTPFGPKIWICCTLVLFGGTFATTVVSLFVGFAFLTAFFPVIKKTTLEVAKPSNFQH